MTEKCYGEQVETETKQRLFRLYNVNPIKCVITQFFTIIDKTTRYQPRGVLFTLSNVLHLVYLILPIILADFGGLSLPGR